MLDFAWLRGDVTDFLECPSCGDNGIYYESKTHGQVCVKCHKEFAGVVTKKLIVTVSR